MTLAKYDKNRNGKLDPDELAAMETDMARDGNLQHPDHHDVVVLQPFGVVAELSPDDEKKFFDRQIQAEQRRESVKNGFETEPYSKEVWQRYWIKLIKGYQTDKIGTFGYPTRQNAGEYVRYILSERRRLHLPDLNLRDSN